MTVYSQNGYAFYTTVCVEPQFSSDDKSLKGSDIPESGDGIARFICIQLSVGSPYPVYLVSHTGSLPALSVIYLNIQVSGP